MEEFDFVNSEENLQKLDDDSDYELDTEFTEDKLQDLVTQTTSEFYKYLNFTREDVQRSIIILAKFTKKYNKLLNDVLQNRLENSITKEIKNEIDKNFNDFAEPFQFFDTEKKRLTIYKHLGLYSEPKLIKIDMKDKYCYKDQKHIFISKSIYMVLLSMEHSLKLLLEMDGLFEAMKSYMAELEKEKNTIRNFIQGDL